VGHVASANLHRRHLSGEQRLQFRAEYIKAHAGGSDRKIAAALQVNHPTIAADRKRIAAIGKDSPVEPAVPTEPAAPVGDPSADAQPRLGRVNKTRRLPQRAASVADPAITATTQPSNTTPPPPWWQQEIDAHPRPTPTKA
jgi:hypothetical protein